MNKITAHQCEFCNKILKSYSGMNKHEKKCFYNPLTKSCITCKYLMTESVINGRLLTEKEHTILRYEVDGTYQLVTGYDEAHCNQLNKEYQYLYNSEPDNYCESLKSILSKLTTNCNNYGRA